MEKSTSIECCILNGGPEKCQLINNNYFFEHNCICKEVSPIVCIGNTHDCICKEDDDYNPKNFFSINDGRCRAEHDCTCKETGPEKCKSNITKCECLCDEPNTKCRTTRHKCICIMNDDGSINPNNCKNIYHISIKQKLFEKLMSK